MLGTTYEERQTFATDVNTYNKNKKGERIDYILYKGKVINLI